MNALIRRLAVILTAALLLTGFSSPNGGDADAAGTSADAVVIVAGAHANQPAAQIPVELATALEKAVRAEAPITVVANDGTPAVVFQISGYTISTVNPEATRNDVNGVTTAVIAAVKSVKADSDGNDLGAALAVARDQVVADRAVTASIIVIDSGLSDRGYPMLTTPGILVPGTSTQVVEVAQQSGYLPMMPAETSVTLVALGYTAPPQPDLTPHQRDEVKIIWRTFLEAAGATIVMIDKPRTGEGPETTFSTGIVTPGSYETLSFSTTNDGTVQATLGSDVLFAFGSAHLGEDAQTALNELRDFLASTSGSILITGHTDATGSDSENLTLSHARAESTKVWLEAHGIDGSRMSTVGRGSAEPAVADATTRDQLQQNRRVVVTVAR